MAYHIYTQAYEFMLKKSKRWGCTVKKTKKTANPLSKGTY